MLDGARQEIYARELVGRLSSIDLLSKLSHPISRVPNFFGVVGLPLLSLSDYPITESAYSVHHMHNRALLVL